MHKNNMVFNSKQRFGFRKLSIGLAAVTLGTVFFLGNGQSVQADAQNSGAEKGAQTEEMKAPAPVKRDAANAATPDKQATSASNRKNASTASNDQVNNKNGQKNSATKLDTQNKPNNNKENQVIDTTKRSKNSTGSLVKNKINTSTNKSKNSPAPDNKKDTFGQEKNSRKLTDTSTNQKNKDQQAPSISAKDQKSDNNIDSLSINKKDVISKTEVNAKAKQLNLKLGQYKNMPLSTDQLRKIFAQALFTAPTDENVDFKVTFDKNTATLMAGVNSVTATINVGINATINPGTVWHIKFGDNGSYKWLTPALTNGANEKIKKAPISIHNNGNGDFSINWLNKVAQHYGATGNQNKFDFSLQFTPDNTKIANNEVLHLPISVDTGSLNHNLTFFQDTAYTAQKYQDTIVEDDELAHLGAHMKKNWVDELHNLNGSSDSQNSDKIYRDYTQDPAQGASDQVTVVPTYDFTRDVPESRLNDKNDKKNLEQYQIEFNWGNQGKGNLNNVYYKQTFSEGQTLLPRSIHVWKVDKNLFKKNKDGKIIRPSLNNFNTYNAIIQGNADHNFENYLRNHLIVSTSNGSMTMDQYEQIIQDLNRHNSSLTNYPVVTGIEIKGNGQFIDNNHPKDGAYYIQMDTLLPKDIPAQWLQGDGPSTSFNPKQPTGDITATGEFITVNTGDFKRSSDSDLNPDAYTAHLYFADVNDPDNIKDLDSKAGFLNGITAPGARNPNTQISFNDVETTISNLTNAGYKLIGVSEGQKTSGSYDGSTYYPLITLQDNNLNKYHNFLKNKNYGNYDIYPKNFTLNFIHSTHTKKETKTIQEEIHYVDEKDMVTPVNKSYTAKDIDFTRTNTIDDVAKKVIFSTPWSTGTFAEKDNPVVNGYSIDSAKATQTLNDTAQALTQIDNSKVEEITYTSQTSINGLPMGTSHIVIVIPYVKNKTVTQTKSVDEVIKYVDEDNPTHEVAPENRRVNHDALTFIRSFSIDMVNGNVLVNNEATGAKVDISKLKYNSDGSIDPSSIALLSGNLPNWSTGTFAEKNNPVVNGYSIDSAKATQTLNHISKALAQINKDKVGKIDYITQESINDLPAGTSHILIVIPYIKNHQSPKPSTPPTEPQPTQPKPTEPKPTPPQPTKPTTPPTKPIQPTKPVQPTEHKHSSTPKKTPKKPHDWSSNNSPHGQSGKYRRYGKHRRGHSYNHTNHPKDKTHRYYIPPQNGSFHNRHLKKGIINGKTVNTNRQTRATLPATDENKSSFAILGLGLAAVSVLISLAIDRKLKN